jgi:hypothetical protein
MTYGHLLFALNCFFKKHPGGICSPMSIANCSQPFPLTPIIPRIRSCKPFYPTHVHGYRIAARCKAGRLTFIWRVTNPAPLPHIISRPPPSMTPELVPSSEHLILADPQRLDQIDSLTRGRSSYWSIYQRIHSDFSECEGWTMHPCTQILGYVLRIVCFFLWLDLSRITFYF